MLPENTITLSNPLINALVMFLLGVILAATLIIPGISGSMLFMAIGFYFYLFQLAGNTIEALKTFDIILMFTTGWPLIILALGLVVGLVSLANLFSFLLKNHSRRVYIAILGILIASPYSIIVEALGEYPEAMSGNLWITISLAIVLGIIGFVIAFIMDRLETKKD
jgi:putative membrane protein